MNGETPPARAARELMDRKRFAGMSDSELVRRARELRSRLLAAGLREEVEKVEAEVRNETPITARRNER